MLRKLVGNVIETLWYTKEDDGQTCVGGVGDEEMMLLDSYYKSLNRT